MELLLTSKMSNGFTLVEMILVLGIICIIGASVQYLGLPAIGKIVCLRQTIEMRNGLESERFTAQYSQRDTPIFQGGRGNIEGEQIEMLVNSSSNCNQVIVIKHDGEII